MNDFYFSQITKNSDNDYILDKIKLFSEINEQQIFIIKTPLSEKKYSYEYTDALVLLIPNHKISFINFGQNKELFDDYVEEFIEDLGTISDKYDYRKVIGRPKKWKDGITVKFDVNRGNFSVEDIVSSSKIDTALSKRNCELLISLLTGSINNAKKFDLDIPNNILDRIKQNIILFDGKQTSFIYQKNNEKRIVIQGLSGTGKTELLMHKLKDLYLNDPNSKIAFTCYSKVLSNTLYKRIPEFFNFMKVEEQIKWKERLWCVGSWGSRNDKNSGIYRYICDYYDIGFLSLRDGDLGEVSRNALEKISDKLIEEKGYPFDYMLIDESQDFDEAYFELCEKVTKKELYIAGDIFQSIFDRKVKTDLKTDFLLSKCYRTDPKTLMFAHGLAMGLFEPRKLRWLTDEDWKSCGYLLEKKGKEYLVKREPLRRFDGFEDVESIELYKSENKMEDIISSIISIMLKLKEDNPTILPSDIAIMFPNNNKTLYTMCDILEPKINEIFDWQVNKSYESKQKIDNQVFVSNRNNVKGLEFPFVICVTTKLITSFDFRNALYMMLTRSFIKSFFITIEGQNEKIITGIETSLNEIQDTGIMTITEPSDEEKKEIEEKLIQHDDDTLTQSDIVFKLFYSLNIPEQFRQKILENIESRFPNVYDEEKLSHIIQQDHNLLAYMDN